MLAALVAAAWGQAAPETQWTPVLQLRERARWDGAGALEQRARLGLEVERLAVSARVVLEDVRAWEVSPDVLTPSGAGPALSEGWIHVEGHLTRNVGAEATVGRQPVTFHEGRILGEDAFEPSGRRLDAVRVLGRAAPFAVEYVQAHDFDGPDGPERGVSALRAGASGENPVTTWVADGLWVLGGQDDGAAASTFGGYARFDTGRLRSRVDGYVQPGESGSGSLVGVSGGWVFGPNERLVVHARWESTSGDRGGARWRPVLGDSRRFQGLLDVYADPDTRPDGVSALQLAVESRPVPALALSAVALHFVSADAALPMGAELDAAVTWWFSPFAKLRAAGGGFLSDGGDAERLFGYVELDASF